MKKLFTTLILVVFLILSAISQTTGIKEIVENPGEFIEEKVEVEGTVTQFVPETSTTNAHYLLEGRFGNIIKVKTASTEPEKNRVYKVTGTVYSENGRPFIHEQEKECLDCSDWVWKDEYLIYVIIGGGILLILIVVILVLQLRKSKKATFSEIPTSTVDAPYQPEDEKYQMDNDEDFKTIKFSSTSDPKTMKFIPGRLEIISGDDKGKSFRFAGYPTPEGSIVTIGRKEITGDRAFAHILLDKKFQTVSRQQAELIYKNQKLYVRNMSEVNPTQVDGIELKEGQEVELKVNGIMRTGELEFKYLV